MQSTMSSRSSAVRASPKASAAPKRRASARLSASQAEVKRVKSNTSLEDSSRQVTSTTKKSKYFEPESSAEPNPESSESEDEGSGSAYEEEEENQSSSGQDSEPEEVSDSDGESRKKYRAKENKQPRSDRSEKEALKGKELWREGVKTGLGPGKEVFIPKPKARDPGDIPYQDETLHPNTWLFLMDLANNNEREWFKAHDDDYRAAKKDFETFVESLTAKFSEMDSTIPELPVKDLVFRIHRDVRFSKNPLPYKTHFSAAWSRTGKKGPYAAYYVHFQPGSCFIGGGLWHPESDTLAVVRQDINMNARRWKEVLGTPGMRREFLSGAPDDEDAVVKAFAHHNRESALKTKPRDYNADNENIQLLRLRSFTVGRPMSDADLTAGDAQDKIASLVGVMEPFVTYLNSVVMPDQ